MGISKIKLYQLDNIPPNILLGNPFGVSSEVYSITIDSTLNFTSSVLGVANLGITNAQINDVAWGKITGVPSYIQNQLGTPQSANFNITGTGKATYLDATKIFIESGKSTIYYRGTGGLGLELFQANDAAHSGSYMYFNNWSSNGYGGGWQFGNSAVNSGVLTIFKDGQVRANYYSGTGIKLAAFDNSGYMQRTTIDPNNVLITNHNEPANSFLAAPNGTSGNPTFRAIRREDLQPAFGAQATGGDPDWNGVANTKPGSTVTLMLGNTANAPSGFGDYYHPFNFEYATKDGTGNLTQFAIPYIAGAGSIYYRSRYNGTFGSWLKIWDSNNLTNVSQLTNNAGYITSAALTSYVPLAGSSSLNGHFIPLSDDTINLGSATKVFGEAYLKRIFSTDVEISNTLTLGGDNVATEPWVLGKGYTTNVGTVTSVAMTTPTGLTILGSPITTSGTLALTFTSGYSIPTTVDQTNWSSAYTYSQVGHLPLAGGTLTGTLTGTKVVMTTGDNYFNTASGKTGFGYANGATLNEKFNVTGNSFFDGTVRVAGDVTLNSVPAAASSSSFLVLYSSKISYRTPAQVLTDIGGLSAANLGLGTATNNTQPITNSGGTGIILPAVTTTVAGLMAATDKTKLDGIEANAQVNIQADYNQTNTNSDAYINNKPLGVTNNFLVPTTAKGFNGGGLGGRIQVINTDYTIPENILTIIATDDLTLTMPNPANYAGRLLYIRVETSKVVSPSGYDILNAGTPIELNGSPCYSSSDCMSGTCFMIQSDSSDWLLVGKMD